MPRLELFSEPFAPTGNIGGTGFQNLLGRPSQGLLTTVLREALQNSVDAALAGFPTEVLIRTRELNESQLQTLRATLPVPSHDKSSLASILDIVSSGRVRVLEICDFATTGLSGPTRADEASSSEAQNFVNFMRNVGIARGSGDQTGGTYGYGKSSLYAMSRCATILVDTSTRHQGHRIRRFMAAHLGEDFEKSERRYTGRHWWGIYSQERVQGRQETIEPLEGEEAAELARLLGMPERKDIDEQMGTSIMMLDPLLEEDDEDANENDGPPLSLEEQLVEEVLWNFWPRMTKCTERERRLEVRLVVDGRAVELPCPEEFPPLDLFAAALKRIRSGSDEHITKIKRYSTNVGNLAIVNGLALERTGVAQNPRSRFHAHSARVALMRPVDLVVRYEEGRKLPDNKYEWGGVFRCMEEPKIEDAFARAEPPAHDDWIPENLPSGPSRSIVKVALREIREQVRKYGQSRPAQPEGDGGYSMRMPARLMGTLLTSKAEDSPRASSPQRARRHSSRRSGRWFTQPEFVELREEGNDRIIAIFRASVSPDGEKLALRATPYLVTEDGSEKPDELPNLLRPSVDWIRHVEDDRAELGEIFFLEQSGPGELNIAVQLPSMEAAVGLRLAEEMESEMP